MAETVGDFVVRRLRDWGVRRVFGYPGDGITERSDSAMRKARSMT